jgi:hypothetical protein
LFEINFSIKLLTISSETSSPELIIEKIFDPNSVLFLISLRKSSPVDN